MLTDKLTLTVEEAAKVLSLGRTATYEAVRTGIIPAIKIGRRIIIPRVALEKMLDAAVSDDANKDSKER